MLTHYLPVIVMSLLAVGLSVAILTLGYLLSPKKPNKSKELPYECGFDAFGDARIPFDVRFFLVAILFIIFDLETAFFFPWAVVLRKLSWFGMGSMGLFILILTIGFIYEWNKGALEW